MLGYSQRARVNNLTLLVMTKNVFLRLELDALVALDSILYNSKISPRISDCSAPRPHHILSLLLGSPNLDFTRESCTLSIHTVLRVHRLSHTNTKKMTPAIDYHDYLQNHMVNVDHLGAGWTSNETFCPICYVDWTDSELDIVKMRCGHTFHKTCILTWMDDHRDCALCRDTLWSAAIVPDDYSERFFTDPLAELADSLEEVAMEGVDWSVYEELDEETIMLLTGVHLRDAGNVVRFVQASIGIYDTLPKSDIALYNVIRKSLTIQKMCFRYDGDMNAQEWLCMMKELNTCRMKIKTLGDDPSEFPAHLGWSALQVWHKMIVMNTAIFDFDGIDLEAGQRIATSYRRSNRLTSSEQQASALQQFLTLQQLDAVGQAAALRQDLCSSSNSLANDLQAVHRIEYMLEEGHHIIAPYNEDIIIATILSPRRSKARIRIALNHPGAISDMSVSADEQEVEIHTSDGNVLGLSFQTNYFLFRMFDAATAGPAQDLGTTG